jgi:hypothetical protein
VRGTIPEEVMPYARPFSLGSLREERHPIRQPRIPPLRPARGCPEAKENTLSRKKGTISAGALFMGLVVMLGLLGLVAGLWSKNLIINGTVQTGDLNADWDCGFTNDDNSGVVQGAGCAPIVVENPQDNGVDPNNFNWPGFTDSGAPPKDVGECELSFDPDAEFGFQEATVAITNAYPSYECTITMYLTNRGSIPFNIISADLALAPGAAGNIETIDAAGNDQCDPSTIGLVQVDPGEEQPFSCTVHVTQTAGQGTCTGVTDPGPPIRVTETCTAGPTYQFEIEVCVAQWNEEADAESCKNSLQHEGPGTVVRVQSPPLSFGPNGWGGWSCPAGTHVVGGGYEPGTATVQYSAPAKPGESGGSPPATYPVYPHYTFTPPETGWVVQNNNDSETITIFVICAPD